MATMYGCYYFETHRELHLVTDTMAEDIVKQNVERIVQNAPAFISSVSSSNHRSVDGDQDWFDENPQNQSGRRPKLSLLEEPLPSHKKKKKCC